MKQNYAVCRLFVLPGLLLIGSLNLNAQEKTKFLNAAESDPIKMGWMTGAPPAKDRTVYFEDGSFFQFPALRWSAAHMRQFMPTTNVSRGLGNVNPLAKNIRKEIDQIKFIPLGETKAMTWQESLQKVYADGVIVMQHGKIVYEQYFGALKEDGQHAAMSVTKSLTGTLGIMLAKEGLIDTSKLVSHYIPELKNSAFGDATVRQVMDMTTALQFSEDYADPNAEIWKFSAAGNPLPKPKDYNGPKTYYEYLPTVKKNGVHGTAFGYKTVNSDVLGWIIARVTRKTVAEVLSEKIWRKLGTEQDAYYSVDAVGTPFAGGGFNMGLRDMARFGQLVLNNGFANGKQIIPKSAIDDIRKGGSKAAFEKANYTLLKGWSYRNMWWITHNEDGAFCARGVHGQVIYIDPKADMVIVRFSSNPVASNSANDPYSLPAYHALAKFLMANK
ncbi:serine hydrolase domain-containing protein [Pedobacter heparinus]|uniref:6-aminohexanoate-dimer hydrolase n=1 Tax=Pedobacter heparinus (strain ATCC 13125 / DSM 2366 / CIP 104194 / JCM 7457 / NBRC 12017 / NCIMB 9290 / NRRL B-14731 / HIM 762-3) TaxID=485917 RepID=C6XX09_PEDHD|nr:serine hydrolase [Pedobacter heparinus]ACU04303.1 6-aminohexanoate-dimer hydrolase [Pedobacter heparinus DSM 2366]